MKKRNRYLKGLTNEWLNKSQMREIVNLIVGLAEADGSVLVEPMFVATDRSSCLEQAVRNELEKES